MDQPLPNVITNDTPCRKCSYNLRGLSSEGLCPQCGAAAGLSLHGDLLKFSDPSWLRTLALGARLIVSGIAVVLIGLVGIVVLAVAFLVRQTSISGAIHLWETIVVLVGQIFLILGAWLITKRDLSGLGEDKYRTIRHVIRITIAVALLEKFFSLPLLSDVIAPTVSLFLRFIGGVAGYVALIAKLKYFAKLADRIPDQALAHRADLLRNLLPLLSFVDFLVTFLIELFHGPGTSAAGPVFGVGCFSGLLGLALLVLYVRYMFLIEELGMAFRRQAEFATQIWQQAKRNS